MSHCHLHRVVVREPNGAQGHQRHILRVIKRIRSSCRIVLARGLCALTASEAAAIRYSTISESGYSWHIEGLKCGGLNPCHSTKKVEDREHRISGRGTGSRTAAAGLRTERIRAAIDKCLDHVIPILNDCRADHGILESVVVYTLQLVKSCKWLDRGEVIQTGFLISKIERLSNIL